MIDKIYNVYYKIASLYIKKFIVYSPYKHSMIINQVIKVLSFYTFLNDTLLDSATDHWQLFLSDSIFRIQRHIFMGSTTYHLWLSYFCLRSLNILK